jgi:phage tail sheath protein FI
LKYGASYTPNIETIFNYFYAEAQVNILRSVDGIAAVAAGTMDTFNPATTTGADGTQYALIKAAIDQLPLTLPPSPLVVGQYANVDSTRGVWKAPANVALSSVIKPTLKITEADQENLNVDTSGKSINAIRAFTGKGTLIWGSRTLDGNSNEWRYVPVRRFFNMAEESIKKATEQFVFEPNDANTWVKVRAMIVNFLTLQWRAGALAGAKPEQAFYVNIGLNETMTALDILEGRMIVEIGMAVVRPAEFIILKFSHKMQES